ncbi:hypothetical protein [Microbacterium sp.]|uniref:hypothetical protein n=1 Tax=Microbacterium sp. TaxID=51671 RepID=UPI003242818E
MKKLGSVAALLGAALLFAGCAAGGTTYASPQSLKDAYISAGGQCDNPQEIPEAMLSEGAHGILCAQPMTMLIVFDDKTSRDRYLARTGGSSLITFGGERWIAASESSEVVSKIGGDQITH